MNKKETIISLYLKGKTPEQIEEESGASPQYVKRVMKDYKAEVVEASYGEIENIPPFIKEGVKIYDKVQEPVKRSLKERSPSWPEELAKTCDEVQEENNVKLFRTETPSQVNLEGYIESFQGTVISGQYNVIGEVNIEENRTHLVKCPIRTLLVQCPLNGGIYGVKAEDVT